MKLRQIQGHLRLTDRAENYHPQQERPPISLSGYLLKLGVVEEETD